MFTRRFVFAFTFAFALSLTALAQEFRGSINGRITDNSGAAVSNATVVVSNIATNSSASLTTDEGGAYTALYLTPGNYTVSVEAKGFKKTIRNNIEVRVGDKLALNVQLEVGAVNETVNITTDAPLLDTNTGSAGQVIDRRRISELPLSDGNPFVLTRLAPGIAYTGDLLFSRPFDNGGTSSIVADGAPGGNEFTLDGTPNQASGRRVAFVPPADAVQEFKVETASFDGQQSHTAGATVNVTMRGGANQFHGTAYEFVRNDILSANNFFSNFNKRPRDVTRYNRYGGTFGGPVVLPSFGQGGKPYWVGRDRSFFFFAYEGLKDSFQEPGSFTVPTLAMRQGDFSALLPSIVIYDPATARQNGARVERSAFPGNRIPSNRFSPIALNYLKYYPEPNTVVTDPLGTNNFFSTNPRSDNFHSESIRFDQTISEAQRFFVRYSQNNRREARGNWTGVVNGIRPTGNFLYRINKSGTFDHIYNLSASTVLNTRVGYSRFVERSDRQHQGEFSPASLGFSPAAAAFFGDASYLPRFEIGGVSVLGDTLGDNTTFNIYSVQPTLTRVTGNHSFKMGYDFRSYRENNRPAAHAAGRYDFGNTYTRQLDTSANVAGGQQLAAFLLGQPTGGLIDRNTSRSNQTLYNAPFFHDDWKVSRKLTLNLGLRYEYEGATTERFNRNVAGFDATVASPVEAAAKAVYAANPIPEVTAANFNVKGGLLFTTADNRSFWDADKNNLQPRVGLAYQLSDKTVLRGGWGVYTVPFIINAVNQPGFSQATNIVPTTNVGLSFQATLANSFPNGVDTPPGASLGLATFLGRDITFFPNQINNPQTQRFTVGVQREILGNWVVEATYVGNRGYDLTTGAFNFVNPIPRQYLSTSQTRDTTVINFLGQNFINPFRNLTPFSGTGFFTNANQSRAQLLRPFPQFGAINSIRNDGTSIYHSGQLRAEKRFSKGYSLLAAYTWSKYIERVSFLNDVDADFERRISRDDVPHRVVASGIYELPFGKGRKFGGGWNSYVDGVLGGWQLNGIFQWQSGRPLDLGGRNVYFNGDASQLAAAITSANADPTRKVFDVSGFYFHDAAVQTNGADDPVKQRADQRIALANNLRYFPTRFSGLRGQNLHLWDLSVMKKVKIYERLQLELRGEFLNAFNHVQFNDPETNPTSANFGRVTSQANLPRNVQIGVKLIF
ncbi:MAG: TonB-dependent receptor [Acidobacteria bacterium]|nr:TonB-dependent receptor [Acidobacteriota bacterium]